MRSFPSQPPCQNNRKVHVSRKKNAPHDHNWSLRTQILNSAQIIARQKECERRIAACLNRALVI